MFTLGCILQHRAFCRDVIGIVFAKLSRLDLWMCVRTIHATPPPKHIIMHMNAAQLAYIEPYIEGFSNICVEEARLRNDNDAIHFLLKRCSGIYMRTWTNGFGPVRFRLHEPGGRKVASTKELQRNQVNIDMTMNICEWSVPEILSACRFMHADWYNMLKGGCSRKYVAAALLYGNIELLDEMFRRGDIQQRNDEWMLGQMRHARTWRWLCSKGVNGSIVLKLDPKPTLIVALHRAHQPYKLATMSEWVGELIKTLHPM